MIDGDAIKRLLEMPDGEDFTIHKEELIEKIRAALLLMKWNLIKEPVVDSLPEPDAIISIESHNA